MKTVTFSICRPNPGVVPALPKDAPVGVTLLAGGGGVECSMVMAGIRPVISVECDYQKPELSRELVAQETPTLSRRDCPISVKAP